MAGDRWVAGMVRSACRMAAAMRDRAVGVVRPRRRPRVRQHDATDCGAACLTAVAAYYGTRTTGARVRQLAGTDREGTTLLGLVDAAARLGLVARGVRGPAESLARLPLPAIAHLTLASGAQHYQVVYQVTRGRVLTMDPADGRLHRVTREEFALRWTGIALLLTPASPGGAAAAPPAATPAVRFWTLVQPHRTLLAQALLGALAYTVLGLATSVYVRHVVDHVLADENRNLLNLMSAAMVMLLVAQAYVGAMKGVLALRAGQRIDAQLIAGYYAHLLRLPQRFFDTMRVGEITARVSDAVKIRAFINDAALDIVVSALVAVLATALIAAYSPTLAVVTMGAAPLYWAVYAAANHLNRRHQRALMERGAELESHLVESISAAATVKRFGVEWFAELRAETRLVRTLRAVYASALTTIVAGAGSELLARLVAVALLWVGAGLVIGRELTPGALMSCYALLAYLTAPLGRLVSMNRTAQDALIAADRLFEIMDLAREDDGVPRIDLDPDAPNDVRFELVSARYGGRRRVLHEVSFTAPGGAVTAVVGESGSGKSTLAALVQRIYPADAGRVCIGEHDVAQLSLPSVRRAVGVVPQRADLFTGTLLENVALGELEPDPRRVVEVCRLVGLADFVGSLPHGVYTQVGEQGAALSGGQRQRVAIARALYHRRAVLILDEATAALDSIAERQVQRAVRERARGGCAVLVIAHRLSTVVDADNIVVLDAGRVVEEGRHRELLGRRGAYARLWAHQYPTPAPEAAA